MTIMVANNGNGLDWNDVLDYLGDQRRMFWVRYSAPQRLGQAFMNSLSPRDYHVLSGSLFDPFYRDDKDSVIRALEYLLSV